MPAILEWAYIIDCQNTVWTIYKHGVVKFGQLPFPFWKNMVKTYQALLFYILSRGCQVVTVVKVNSHEYQVNSHSPNHHWKIIAMSQVKNWKGALVDGQGKTLEGQDIEFLPQIMITSEQWPLQHSKQRVT